MGKNDSSRTRVAPVLNWLQCWDPSGREWLKGLLRTSRPLPSDIQLSGLTKALWWPREARLPAPVDLTGMASSALRGADRQLRVGQGKGNEGVPPPTR